MTDKQGLRVLVVDDEASFRLAISSLLEERGYRVESCESGEEALEWLERASFDIILLDYWLPLMSGINVLQRMHEQKNDTPVIMLTGAGSETVAVEAMSLGAYDYIPKERIEVDHLPITINSVHERHLFRKERERRPADEQFRQRTIETVSSMRTTLHALSHVLNNNLTLMSLNMEDCLGAFLPMVPLSQRPQAEKLLTEMQEGLRLVTSGVSSMLTLSESVHQQLSGSIPGWRLRQDLMANIDSLEEEYRKAMEDEGEQC